MFDTEIPEWLLKYFKKVEKNIIFTSSSIIELPSDVLHPVCRKHTMLIFQNMFVKNICPFFLPTEMFSDIFGNEIKFWPIAIEELPFKDQNQVYVRLVKLENLNDFRICAKNTVYLDNLYKKYYEKNIDCIWCHKTWISLGVSFLLKDRNIYDISIIEVEKLQNLIVNNKKEKDLSLEQKLTILRKSMIIFHDKDRKNIRRKYTEFIKKLRERSSDIDHFHDKIDQYQKNLLIYSE